MEILRTPEENFADLPDYPFEPHYCELNWQGRKLRMHYLDEGESQAPAILMLHGEPSWSFLYRKMIPIFVAAGFRAIAPDLIGFGRSDKPDCRDAYTYQNHVDWLRSGLDSMTLTAPVHLFCQDWGGLLGLRIAGEEPDRFASIAAANTFLPTGDQPPGKAFLQWREYSQNAPEFNSGGIVAAACSRGVSKAVQAAYDAPFPSDRYKAGARAFPMLVPVTPDDPASEANRNAWRGLLSYQRPFLTCFSDNDPITAGADQIFQAKIPGAHGQPHFTVGNAGHFLQEDAGEELATGLVKWLGSLAAPDSESV